MPPTAMQYAPSWLFSAEHRVGALQTLSSGVCHVDQGYRTVPFLYRQMSHILVDHMIHMPLIGNDFPAIDMQWTCI
jgi:hypothetical protein